MKKMLLWAKSFWASLPHQVQAGAVVFATVALTTLGKELDSLLSGAGAAFTWLALKHDITAACVAGFVALRAFYMLPNRLIAAPTPTPNPTLPPA